MSVKNQMDLIARLHDISPGCASVMDGPKVKMLFNTLVGLKFKSSEAYEDISALFPRDFDNAPTAWVPKKRIVIFRHFEASFIHPFIVATKTMAVPTHEREMDWQWLPNPSGASRSIMDTEPLDLSPELLEYLMKFN